MTRQTLNLAAGALTLALTLTSSSLGRAGGTDDPAHALLGQVGTAFSAASTRTRPVGAEQALLGRWVQDEHGGVRSSADAGAPIAIGPEQALLGK